MNQKQAVIIGGGASGLLAAVALLRKSSGLRIVLVERSNETGRGFAFGTEDDSHLLNVRASNMSGVAEEPSHFVDWLRSKGHDESDLTDRFRPRKQFRLYLQDTLATAQAGSESSLEVVTGAAVSVGPSTVTLEDGTQLHADAIVLALGNLPPALPYGLASVKDDPRVIANPWLPDAYDSIGTEERVLLIGTGLTMFDAVLSLVTRGHTGMLYARSRRGLVSLAQAPVVPRTIPLDRGGNVSRQVIRAAREAGDDWRAVIDGLRPITAELWQAFSWPERKKWLARIDPFWCIHRHRAAGEVADTIESLRETGQLSVARGTMQSSRVLSEGIEVSFETGERLEVDRIVNCTGPQSNLAGQKLPVLESAVALGMAEYDPLGLGLMVDDAGRTCGDAPMWAIGTLCRGCRLESNAIPEIRVQAATVAEDVIETLQVSLRSIIL